MLFLLCITIIVINIHNIVIVTYKTTDAISIWPNKKFLNWSINDKSDKLSIRDGIHVDVNTTANVIIPDIIGDSVKLDDNIPTDMYVIESSINPNIDVKYIGTFGTSK